MIGFNPSPKPQHKRGNRTAKQRGHISDAVREIVNARSNGVCERCDMSRSHGMAHITRRWKIDETTERDLLDLCTSCHTWADQTREGRAWLKSKERR